MHASVSLSRSSAISGWRPAIAGLLIAGLVFVAFGACSVDERAVKYQSLEPAPGGGAVPCALDCPEVKCPPDDVCKDYAEAIPAGSCSPAGTCAVPADCSATWQPAARDGAACECGADACRLIAGEACTAAGDCASAQCLATNAGTNLCCAVPCSPTEACTTDGAGCEPVQACADGDRRCSGSTHQECTGQQWVALTECGELGCNDERGGCLRLAGQACEADADCGEGACRDTTDGTRVCCTADCSGDCRRCTPAGVECAELEDDPACGTITCPTGDPCRQYVATVESRRCAAGACAAPEVACTFDPINANGECNATTLCDDAGDCTRPKLATNEPCSVAAECLSGACVASESGGSVCCSSACSLGEFCGQSGVCVLAPVCANGATQCSGSSYQRCNAGQWVVATECGTLGCSEEVDGCLADAGGSCQSDDDCGAGLCQPTASGARVCCTAACGNCRRCATSGTTCENLADDAACGVVACQADSDTDCRDFPPSVTSQRCVDGRCGSQAQLCFGTPTRSGQACSATSRCDNAGNCNLPLLGRGATCNSGNQCSSGFCTDGVCCDGACGDTCQTCAGSGVCRQSTEPQCVPVVTPPPAQPGGGGFGGGGGTEQVQCGSDVCTVGGGSSEVCCASFGGGPVCTSLADCPAPPSIQITCDDHLDCGGGTVCCRVATDNIVIECRSAATCAQPATDSTSFQQLCGSPFQPVTVLQCPSGQECFPTPDSRLPSAFAFCQ